MNGVPLHPALVHIPVGIALVLPLVALFAAVAIWRGWIAPRVLALIVLLQAVVVAGGLAALYTGEQAEERVEATAGEAAIERHEEAAQRFMLGAGFALAAGVAGLIFLRRPGTARWTAAGLTAVALLQAGLAVSAGKRGGEIAHGNAQAVRGAESHEDDDD